MAAGRAERGDTGAAAHFRTYHDWTTTAVDALLGSGALTPAGVDFLHRTAETLASWR